MGLATRQSNHFTVISSIPSDLPQIFNGLFMDVTMPSAECPYEATDECTSGEPQSCCASGISSALSQVQVHWLLYTILCTISVAALALL